MGAWGTEPYDNDGSADWFGDTMAKTKLPKRIGDTLKKKDPYYDNWRAAAYLLQQIGHVYVYDINVLEEHLALAVVRMNEILTDKEWIADWKDSAKIKRALKKQIKELERNFPGNPNTPYKTLVTRLQEKYVK